MERSAQQLFIFDIDGTLLLNGDVTRNAFAASFEFACGVPARARGIAFAGMTDRGIFRALLQQAGRDPGENEFEHLFANFARHFIGTLEQVYPKAEGPHLLEGAHALVHALAEQSGAALALGTGNIRETAYLKLARFELDSKFPVGGFGGDHEERSDVVRAAMRQARERLGWNGAPRQAWVIGDTVNDVLAARAAGVRALAVASGFTPADALAASKPDALVDSLRDTAALKQLLTTA